MENDFYLTIEQIMKKHNIKDSRHLESRLCFLEKDIEARKKEYKELSNSLLKILIKLNEYESIEDELGIDLITLFKALTKDVYIKQCKKIIKVETPPILLNFDEEYYLEWHCEKLKDSFEQLPLKDYGKTWALTEGELL